MRDTTPIPQPVGASPETISGFPSPPDKLIRSFPEFSEYHDNVGRRYRSLREAFIEGFEQIAFPVAKVTKTASDLTKSQTELKSELESTKGTLTAIASTVVEVTTEVDEITGDVTSLAERVGVLESTISTPLTELEARVDTIEGAYVTDTEAAALKGEAISAAGTYTDGQVATKNKTFLQPSAPTATAVGDIWYNSSDNKKPYRWSGTGWIDAADIRITDLSAAVQTIYNTYVTSTTATSIAQQQITASISSSSAGTIGAAVNSEASARATADGFLSGKYTLAVDVNGVVTGMNITASNSGGTTTTNIQFLADKFQIYNGSTATAPFEVAGGVVYIKSAVIRNLSANVITTGTLSAITISGNTITGGTISGTTISGTTINGGTIDGASLSSATISSGTINVFTGQIDTLTAGAAGTGQTTTTFTTNGRAWVKGDLVVARGSSESGAIFAKEINVGGYPSLTNTSGPRVSIAHSYDTTDHVKLTVLDVNNQSTTIEGTNITTSSRMNFATTSGDFSFATSSTKRMRFGEYTAGSGFILAGYITIKDSGGTERKLAVYA